MLGLGFLLQQSNLSWADRFMYLWWPILIIAIGLISWRSSRRLWFGPLVITLVGIILLLDHLDVFSASAWNYFWPTMIIAIGAKILIGRSHDGAQHGMASTANATALFSGVERKVTGPLADNELSAWFGGVKLDLREAQFPDQSTLEVFVGFGGIEILIPRSVRVVTKIMPLFGGVEDKTRPEAAATKTLTISGTALFGGVGVKQ